MEERIKIFLIRFNRENRLSKIYTSNSQWTFRIFEIFSQNISSKLLDYFKASLILCKFKRLLFNNHLEQANPSRVTSLFLPTKQGSGNQLSAKLSTQKTSNKIQLHSKVF
jgi:hypothetical protein